VILDGKDFQWEWVTNYYDTPLEGYARYNGKVFKVRRVSEWGNWFNPDYDDDKEDGPDNPVYAETFSDDFEAVPVTGFARLVYWAQRTSFEIFVGRHWTYHKGKRLDRECRSPVWLHRIYYKFLKPLFG